MFKQDYVRCCLNHFVSDANKRFYPRYTFQETENWFSVVCDELFVSSVVISRLPDFLLSHLCIASHGDKIYLRFEKSDFPLS